MGDERIFISYARSDGTQTASSVRARLIEAKLRVWQDLIALQGGRDWWSQIEEALRSKSLQHFVLIITPNAMDSTHVHQEIRLARQEGKQVHPVRGPGFESVGAPPRWLGHVIDPTASEQWEALLTALRGQSQRKRTPMMAPEPPADFVARPREIEELKRALLDEKGDARGGVTAITAALKGAGGYGKTTLAKALAYDPDVQEAFFDGVLWVELGVQPSNLVGTVIDLIERITGERPVLEKIHAAAAALGETLGDRRFLLVIDDAWHPADLQPFLHGGSRTTRLVTTRVDIVVPDDAFRLPVDAMREVEAIQLLGSGLPRDQNPSSGISFTELACRLGKWAQLLKLANGFLRERVRLGEPIAAAIVTINRRLDAKGLTAFDPHNERDRTRAVARTIEVSLDLLDNAARRRFAELAVLPEEVDVPVDVAAALWARTASISQTDAEYDLVELARLSLLHSLDLDQRTFRLHDTMRHYLRHSMDSERLSELSDQLAVALDQAKSSERADAVAPYDYRFRPYHLAEARNRIALNKLLTDPEWIEGKVRATRGALELIKDYDLFASSDQPLHHLIGDTLRLTSRILAGDGRHVLPQIHGRLIGGVTSKEGAQFLNSILNRIANGTLIETRRALKPPGANVGHPEGHNSWVDALAVLPDGRLASGSRDTTIRLWDPTTGRETARLADSLVTALAILQDGRLASGSEDNTIRLWNPVTCRETARLKGHDLGITALTVRSYKDLISGSDDQTIRIWDTTTGRETARLQSYGHGVTALAVLRDGRLVSGSTDTTIRLWDLGTRREAARFEGHCHWVTALAVMPDGRLVSGSHDKTIRLWDVGTGCETARLEGHASWVRALAILPDGRLASGSYDATIRLWDVASGREITRIEIDGTPVALAVLRDGRIIVGDSLGRIHWLAIKGEGEERFFALPAPRPEKSIATAVPQVEDAAVSIRKRSKATTSATLIIALAALIGVIAFAVTGWEPRFSLTAVRDAIEHLYAVRR
jgi:WD40 repeat protein